MLDPTTRDRLRVNLLGPVEVRQGERLLAVPARKDRALLAIVGLARGQSVARARLAGLLWGESTETRARDSLKQALLRLRRVPEDGETPLVVSDRHSVSLGPDVSVDALELLKPGDDAAAEAALGLRRGPFLEGLDVADPGFRDWLLAERARLDTAFADLALLKMRRAEAAGRSAAASAIARQLLAADPFNEEAVRTVMRAHLERGERRLALQFYEATRERMAASLDVEPEVETVELARQIRSAPAAAPAPVPAPAEGSTPSVAVLPFATIGGDPTEDYFADGLTEDIITDLGNISDIRVVARSAAFALKGRSLGAAEAARVLGVSHVLQGSVRHEGGRVRVTARLVEGAGGEQVWASRFDRPLTGIFSLQDELSCSVVEALRGALAPDAGVRPRRGTQDVEAYKLFLKARSFYLRGLDRHNLGTARYLLIQAVERDPHYAEA
ncbi:MAG: hypothetical protein OEM24_06520, partial [Paracoccaceae bacterium]|nr:hypothetical protein [Paracoccaceae bacterium]